MKYSLLLPALFAGLVFLGAGCGTKSVPTSQGPTSLTAEVLQAMTPTQRSANLQFIAGDTIELKTKARDWLLSIQSFVPRTSAAFGWTAATETKTGRVSVEGTVAGMSLATPHVSSLPMEWPVGPTDLVSEKSGIWVSDDAFQELTKTGKTVVNADWFGIVSSDAAKNLSATDKAALNAFGKKLQAAAAKTDLTLLEKDADGVEYPLFVNGTQMNVAVIKAHNKLGDLVILQNRQNPIVLSWKLHPTFDGAGTVEQSLVDFLSYDITRLVVTQSP